MKPLNPNTLIQNRYLIIHLIGKGGMGEVYLAVDQRLGSAVALKRTYYASDGMLGNAFEREAKILARLRHPVLPKVSDHFIENEEQYLIMEHISGDDLGKRLDAAQKPFPMSWVLFWADQLLDALSYMHSHEPPILHRDIKPQNLKLTDENHVILLDFGLSKNSIGQTEINTSPSTGSVVGYTPHYSPMEQIRGTGTNPRSDIYALSATLYQLMTNTVPSDALTRADALLNEQPDPIKPLFAINPEITQAVSDTIIQGMEVRQEKRFAHAREMQKALRNAFSRMQTAMSAQTVAFNVPGEKAAEQISEVVDAAAVKGKNELVDFDATWRMEDVSSQQKPQKDIDTEVLYAEDSLLAAIEAEKEVSKTAEIDNIPAHYAAANMQSEAASPIQPADELFLTSPSFEDQPDFFATRASGEFSEEEQKYAQQAAAASFGAPAGNEMPPKKRSGKALAVAGGLFALLLIGGLALAGGWYAYTNYYAGGVIVEPSPEISPSPEPSVEIVGTDTNTDVEANANTDDLIVGPTPEPTSEIVVAPTPDIEVLPTPVFEPASTPAVIVKTPVKKPTPATKTTPKVKPSDRTVILQ